ncbi:MAG: HslU--HslV peptidase ATPase subunit [spirochete symbiont of Stewartia floridana]|nr:MAG: HslU--HslV peptidase ATPase subunit [spirochete symbiont of Stewartia floridana]
MNKLIGLTPQEIVDALDQYIIGQRAAKKAVAIALRNRQRRAVLPDDIRDEVAPKNILMIGPTGVGKTEIARRLAKLDDAPFIKVEATKFTEVGYVGRDVESMVRDLIARAIDMVKSEMKAKVEKTAKDEAEQILLDILVPGSNAPPPEGMTSKTPVEPDKGAHAREVIRRKLHAGELDDKMVEITAGSGRMPHVEVITGGGVEQMGFDFSSFGTMFQGAKKARKVKVSKAREILEAEQQEKLIDMESASELARQRVQNGGIIFIDEIDKIAGKEGQSSGPNVSREGVQRDILPIVEGSTVYTKYGMVDTSHILFIAAGAFNLSKPSDLIPELQGRFPLRVELEPLSAADFCKILTSPRNALTRQYEELLATEGIKLVFQDEAVARLSDIAAEVNTHTENIGARRLHTVLELLLEKVSFDAPNLDGQTIVITRDYVDERLMKIMENRDLSRYIL